MVAVHRLVGAPSCASLSCRYAAAEALALDTPPFPGEVVGHGVEDPAAVLTRERAGELGRVAGFLVDQVGLRDVEHRHGKEPSTALFFFLPRLRVLDRLADLSSAEMRMPRSPFRTCRLSPCHIR